ncbi:MAG: imm11 family protein [Dysgonomonas sp.]
MKNYAEEYFYMIPFGADYPSLDFVNSMTDSFLLYEKFALDESHVFRFRFEDPVPRNPKMGDAHGNAQHLIISDRIKKVLEAMNLKDVQYLPATIEGGKNNEIFEGYRALHIHNLIRCMDREKSDFKERDGSIVRIKKLVLDSEALGKIPLEERLVFALGEKRLFMFFHKSVVEKILAINPEGVKFAPAHKWNSKSLFEAAYWEYILGD